MFNFWHRWLQAGYIILTLFGLGFAFLGTSSLFAPTVQPILAAFWAGGVIPPETADFAFFAFGLAGALTAALGELGWFVARYGIAQRQRWAWNGLLASLLVWYVLDGAISIYVGAAINLVFNTIFLAMLIVPLIALRSHLSTTATQALPAAA